MRRASIAGLCNVKFGSLIGRAGIGRAGLFRLAAVGLFFLTVITGCDGCRSRDDVVEDGSGAEPRPEDRPLTFDSFKPFPDDPTNPVSLAKPGHWTEANLTITALSADARGSVTIQSPIAGGQATSRAIAVPEKQQRSYGTRLLLPSVEIPEAIQPGQAAPNMARGTSFSATELQSILLDFVPQPSGKEHAGRDSVSLLRPYEYQFVVLTDDRNTQQDRGARFRFLAEQDWSKLPDLDGSDADRRLTYRLRIPASEGRYPVPSQFAAWSTTAFVIWDDLPADRIERGQLNALLDWLHWGGTLIINGPAAIDRMPSEIAALSPLDEMRSVELSRSQLLELMDRWNVPEPTALPGEPISPASDSTPPADETTKPADPATAVRKESNGPRDGAIGVSGQARPGAEELVGTNGLLWRRRVGRGSVVFSAFDLSERWFIKWRSGSSFVHNVLMGRPNRASEGGTAWAMAHDDGFANNSLLATHLRVFVRDARFGDLTPSTRVATGETEESSQKLGVLEPIAADRERIDFDTIGYGDAPGAGLGGWFDGASVPRAAADSLRAAAGIQIPELRFVLRTLAFYLLALVPLNWLIFWSLGRLEWAWLAVPVIAFGGVIAVIRQAQLDIGFARSQHELAVLELYGDYPRGNLTRFVSLYNSLTSTYDIDLAGEDALAAPLFQRDDGRAPPLLELFTRGGTRLAGVRVPSNQTQLLRAEQMIELGGRLELSPDDRLTNRTGLPLRDTLVVRSAPDTRAIEVAVVGRLISGATANLNFQASRQLPDGGGDGVSLGELWQAAARFPPLRSGEYRCLAVCDRLPGMQIEPAAAVQDGQTLVLAYLRLGGLPQPRPDQNLIFQAVSNDDEFIEEEELSADEATP
jgi:hypothetical protein